jgi:tetratricopeptide (TPR) repeat protein
MSNKKPVIFISYSHKDRSWLDYVRSFFEPFAEHWTLQIWDDKKLRIGDDWRGDIYSALDASQVFVLLVSRYALASEFIRTEEVGRILKRPKGEVQFCPIVVTPCGIRRFDWLSQPNRRPPDDKALSELADPARDREMTVIAEQIDEIIERISSTIVAAPSLAPPVTQDKSRTAFPSIVDYGRLPETPYKKLVGRDDELKQLDEAWADEKTRIISLVAWGGAGKTSLAIEWLMRVRNDGYRNANAVLCWSFFSQGTKERAASGEGFLDWALGKLKVKVDTTSSTAKGERLAEEMSRRRVLLVLDGLEPLQYGSEGQQGALKDQGLRAFLRGLAVKPPAAGHSLVVLTSRIAVYDLRKWQDTTARMIDLTRLSDEAGAALLNDGGVIGPPEALREAAHDFAGHALALSLLAGYLRLLHGGDVNRRGRIRAVSDDPNDPGHDQARRVIEAYDKEWLAREPILRTIMYVVGMFDRPATADCVAALRGKPAIDGFSDRIIDLSDNVWREAIARLRQVRLLDPEDSSTPDAIDAHPLVREWFGERLKEGNEKAWRKAHDRIYEHLRDTTNEGVTPTLEDLNPLYQAISHGCCAGRHEDALREIFAKRIFRWQADGSLEFYASYKLGALGSNLAAIAWFFEKPYDTLVSTLVEVEPSWILGEAAFYLRAQGRLAEALPALRASLRIAEATGNRVNAAIQASNLGEAELLVGEVSAALVTAEQAVANADRIKDEFRMMAYRSLQAHTLHAAGRDDESAILFAEAEQRQQKLQPEAPFLYSLQGYRYCDLLLAKGDWEVAWRRATDAIKISRQNNWLLDIALDALIIGRSYLGLAFSAVRGSQPLPDAGSDVVNSMTYLDKAFDGLRAAGTTHHIPRALVARNNLRRAAGDWKGAARDLDEVEEIAEPGPMKLYLCDMALERTRLAFAQIEAFAPLNGLADNSPPKPVEPDAGEAARLKEAAAKQLAIAADYIRTCGYHRRDEELAELHAVLRGEKKFADLPPRV